MRHSDTPDQDVDWRDNALDPFDSQILSSKYQGSIECGQGVSEFHFSADQV